MKIEKKVTKWKAPPKNDVRVLGMPNIPHPLQGCLEGEAEVLTPSGWQRIDSVSTGDTVMCWSNGLLFFDEVQDTIISYTPEAYKIGFIKQRNFDMLYSPNHRIPLGESLYSWGRDGRYKYDTPKEALRVVTAEKYCPNTARYFFTAGRGTGVTGHLTADERILIAIQADGCLRRENKKDRDFVYDLRFNKSRKIARIRALLKDSTFRWRECSDFDGGKLYRIWVDKESKTFSNVFPWAMSYTKAREFIQELWEWDGYVGQSYFGGQRAMYNSCRFDNISFVQAIAAQAGYTTNTVVRKPKDNQSKNWSVWFIDKKTRRCGHTTKTKIPYNSDMYCITVPSSFFLVRYHNVVMITGNSGCQPRTIAGAKVWDQMRKKCYEDAGYKCEACGYEHQMPADLNAHELFDIDYKKGTSTFIRLVCLCRRCHIYFIHSGRALTMYKHGDPLYSKEKLLEGVEHGFKLISEYNKTHKRKIYVFSTIADYLKEPELKAPMEELINRYHIEFYKPVAGKKQAAWGDWKLIWNGKEYKTPYADSKEWEEKMEKMNKKSQRFEMTNRMKGGVFDELDKLLKGE